MSDINDREDLIHPAGLEEALVHRGCNAVAKESQWPSLQWHE